VPNIRSQIVGDLTPLGGIYVGVQGIYVKASDGSSVVITAAQIHAQYLINVAASAVQGYANTQAWIASTIAAGLVPGMTAAAKVSTDFATATGTPTAVAVLV
jgi:hypothetical protein